MDTEREAIRGARRVVVKVGSSSLTSQQDGALDLGRLHRLSTTLASNHVAGTQVVLVSSGAIAAGITPLGLAKRPRDLATQQAAASVGQTALMAAYTRAFGEFGITVGQTLLTSDDLIRKEHYGNARRSMMRLMRLRVLPVVNENDAVVTDEIRFGDNDRLAALVAHVVRADALVLLTDVDALYDGPPSEPGSRPVPLVRRREDIASIRIGGTGSAVGTGGMTTKVEAARIATGAGIPTVLGSAEAAGAILAGHESGTLFLPTASRPAGRMLWLAHASAPLGRLTIDDGAVRALRERGASLLPAGVVRVEGHFDNGAPVEILSRAGTVVARGITGYGSDELPRLLGRSTHWLGDVLGPGFAREVVHRDHLVLL